jgi:CRISPR-associated protein Cmx8
MPAAAKQTDALKFEFHLSELPTAQHKAGLAGLVLQIRNLHDRASDFEPEDLPVLEEVTAHSARIQITERSLQKLFDELYSARMEPVLQKKKKVIEPKRTVEIEVTDPISGKSKLETRYEYDWETPRNPFLMQYLDADIWQKLWREMMFTIPRNQWTTQLPYRQRAEGVPCAEAGKAWKELKLFEKARLKNQIRTTSLAGSLLLGAQDATAEQTPFADRSDHNLLLHFWPLTVMIYVPWLLDINPSQPKQSRDQPVGFALAIPEVCNLEKFCKRFPNYLAGLNEKIQARGYRPREACIDLAEQSALQFLSSLAELVAADIDDSPLQRVIQSVEYRHLAKFGNNVKSLGNGRIVTSPQLLEVYRSLVKTYWNPVFRATRIQGLLEAHRNGETLTLWGSSWWQPFQRILELYPWQCFIRSPEMPRVMQTFPHDLRTVFENIQTEFQNRKENPMTENPVDKPLALLIRSLVRNYVMQKAENRSGQKWDDIKQKKTKDPESGKERVNVPSDFSDFQTKIASGTFLEVRSRHGQDFAQYFVDVFGSVSQRPLLKEEDFLTVSEAVLKTPDDVRILVMLALSANS